MKRSAGDERNQLYKFFYSVVRAKQPKFFIAENVKGILSLDKGGAIKKIVEDFQSAGYIASVNLVNLADYGVPQTRQRVFIIIYSAYKLAYRDFTGHRRTDPGKPSPTILARGDGGGGVCAIPHYDGGRRLTVRESASVQTFPEDFVFTGRMNSCYRQIGNAVPPHFAKMLGEELVRLEREENL